MTTRANLKFVDSHAHLDDEQFAGDVADVISRARVAGVTRIVNIGYEPAKWDTSIQLARQFDGVAITLGLHPQSAGQFNSNMVDELETAIGASGAVAIGEIGIDLFRSGPTLDLQLSAFEAQLALAIKLKLPVVIHQRAATDEVHRVLEAAPKGLRCILHSFEGDVELLKLGLERDYLFGIGGLMTRASSGPIRDLIKGIPLENIVLETDSPYLIPAGVRARRNEPANIPVIANYLADLLEVPVEHVADTTSHNSNEIFRLDQELVVRRKLV